MSPINPWPRPGSVESRPVHRKVFLWFPRIINRKLYWFTTVFKRTEFTIETDNHGTTATGKYVTVWLTKNDMFLEEI